jgi:hypothetical protein
MTTKTHLTSIEESVDEQGIQIRNDEPSSPVENQIWVRRDQKKIKARIGSETVILAEGDPSSLLITALDIDASLSNTFHKAVTSNQEFSILNIPSGRKISLLIDNTSLSPINVTFTNSFIFDETENGQVASDSIKLFTILNVNGLLYVASSSYV